MTKLPEFTRRFLARSAVAFGFFALFAISFVALADEVHENTTTQFDDAILRFINSFSSPLGDTFFVWVTNFGGALVVPALTAVLCAWLWRKGHKAKAVFLGTSVLGAALLNLLVKRLFERARPDLWSTLVTEHSFSFPSGHAMASSGLAFAVILVCWDTRFRWSAVLLGSLYVVIIGFSRLYLGVHYPTDVLGGWLLSLAWVSAVWLLWKTRLIEHPVRSIRNKLT